MASVERLPAYMLPGVPVAQPPHLDGDPSLATEVLPGPPPLHSVQQVGLPRRDHKKSITVLSYLPISDPGTTYGGHMVPPMASTTEIDGPRRKRARLDKGSATSRAQRASARNLSAAAPGSDSLPPVATETMASSSLLVPDSDPLTVPPDSDDAALSRSHSLLNAEDDSVSTSNYRRSHAHRRDKGKGKEKEAVVRVKEEPSAVSLAMPDTVPTLSNEDHCSSCSSLGSLVYCDGCPRAFHLWCLDPPMEEKELPEGDARWLCPSCINKHRAKPKPMTSLKFMSPLVEQLEGCIPVEYQLPQDIKSFFKDVATSPRGAYVDASEVRQLRLNRHGQLEDRDPYRLKDRNGDPVLCYKCGSSALPPGTTVAPAAKRARRETSSVSLNENGRSIVSCDYCPLHWHLDCLDPPLAYMPTWSKKWMCPNHADQALQSKRRIPKANAHPIEITKPGQRNNGIIEIIRPESAPVIVPPKVATDEVLINGRRYKVPEKFITLDFWDKLGRSRSSTTEHSEIPSPISSPLTSLSSLAGDEDVPSFDPCTPLFSMEDVEVAQLLASLRLRQLSPAVRQDLSNGVNESHITTLTSNGTTDREVKPVETNGATRSSTRRPAGGSAKAVIDAGESSRGRRSAIVRRQETVRSAADFDDDDFMDVDPTPAASSRVRRPYIRRAAPRKGGTQDVITPVESVSHPNGTSSTAIPNVPESQGEPAVAAGPSRPKRSRLSGRRKLSPVSLTSDGPGVQVGQESDALGAAESQPETSVPVPKRRKSVSRRRPLKDAPPLPDVTAPTTPPPVKKAVREASPGPSIAKPAPPSTTPSLKIRLPRLGALNLPSTSASALPDPVRNTSPSRTVAQSSSRSRTRRPRRRQSSMSAPFNAVTVTSEAGPSLKIEG